jgi:hypothetical protein
MIGVAETIGGVDGTRLRVSVSGGGVEGVADSKGSGVVSRGRTVAVGAAFGVEVGDVFGLAVGVGVSSGAPGVLARNGVEAASCARTNVAAMRSAMTKTSERMINVSPEKIPVATLACACWNGQEQYPRDSTLAAANRFSRFRFQIIGRRGRLPLKLPTFVKQTQRFSSQAWR